MAFDPSSGPYAFTPGPGERIIYLTKGFTALIDAADWPLTEPYSWHVHFARSNVYARSRDAEGKPLYLHRLLLTPPQGALVDHQNRIPLDCRRRNLRVCGFDKNAQNADYHNSTGFRGVSRSGNRFRSRIKWRGEVEELGSYATPDEAARAYDTAALRLFGPYAWTNFPQALPTVSDPIAELADIPF